MKRILWLVGLLLIATPLRGQNTRLQGFCEDGNQQVTVSGLVSVTRVQRSYPSCTVTVYDNGTSNLSTIYSNVSGTPLGNPVTAATTGQWFFYAVPGNHYDIQFSGGGIATPFTRADWVAPLTGGNTSVLNCSAYSGASASAQITACVSALPTTGGTADARGLLGAQTWNTDAFSGVTKPVDFICGATTYTVSTTSTVPTSVRILPAQGCVFSINAGITFTINSTVQDAIDKTSFATHFIGAGTTAYSTYWNFPVQFDSTQQPAQAIGYVVCYAEKVSGNLLCQTANASQQANTGEQYVLTQHRLLSYDVHQSFQNIVGYAMSGCCGPGNAVDTTAEGNARAPLWDGGLMTHFQCMVPDNTKDQDTFVRVRVNGGTVINSLDSLPVQVKIPRQATQLFSTENNILTTTLLTGGTGYSAARYNVTGGSGINASVDVTVAAGVVQTITVANPGTGYKTTDTLTINGGGSNATFRPATVSREQLNINIVNLNQIAFQFDATASTTGMISINCQLAL